MKKKSFFFLCALILLGQASTAVADSARLTDIIVTNTRDELIFFTTIEDAFNEKITQAVNGGVPVSFSFIITLHQVHRFWFDKKISEIEVSHTIEYNTLREEFVITRSWEENRTLPTRSFAEAKEKMTKIEGLPLCSMNELHKGGRYLIRAKAELDKLKLPFYLHYVLFFLSFWDVETDWHAVYFTY